ncbi:TPA: hypothetical protein N0F65_003567 [Lagenidium giganteum]|uniref:Kinesin motor domain-containing protein n=1 Tax=Lagenidium giganteum TaxID=4803 RepID=A0AAV2Z101_9STRA|nr:TPA: hypothetical protein N0F65_003567 [Lagenidium giganteum]
MTSIAELPTQPLTSSQVTTARQSQTDNIRVLLRIRPTSELETASRRCVELSADGKSIALAPSSLQEKRFTFDQVFGDRSTQDDIFQDAGRMAVDNAINGYNGSIFAYGQTGSGKTFTMMGGVSDSHELRVSPLRGLMPRIFDYMFLRLDEMAAEKGNAFEYACSCSYLEIYNEKIYDLLDESAVAQAKSLREDRNKEVYVEQLRDVSITSEQDAIELLQVGSKNRRIASTDMNRESSRSHAVFTLKLVQTEQSPGGVVTRRRSNLHLVDLAGSEKQRQTNVAGQRLKEAAQINKSLSALGNVIMSLVDVSNGLRRHVHYRDSKLTFLLRDSLGGNAISTMVATISAEEKYFSETLSTLKFAQRAKFIKNNAIQNQDSDSLVPLLKLEIAELRERIQELTLLNANAVAHGPQPTPEFLSPVKHTPEIVRKNRWEPALDIMVKLLRASGAASPADFDDDDQKANCEPVDVRCSRLEMLLYRIICRFEEQKVIAYSPQRFPGYTLGPPSIPKPPSFLPAPKTRYRLKLSENQADHQPLADQHVSTHVKHDRHYTDLEMIHQREQELELENEMLRWQVRDLLAWKTANEKQNSESSQSHHCQCGDADRGSFTSTTTASCSETSVSKGNSLNGNRSLSQLVEDEMDKESLVLPSDTTIELLDAYRGMFENLCELIEEKKSILTPPCSPAASGSSHSSASDAGDDDCASQNDSDDDDSSDDGVDIAREVRRVQEFALKMEGRMDEYQDAIQRLEKDVVNAHDELETATAATKFAEFQLQQLRETTAEDEKRRTELESKVEKLESLCQQHEAHASKMQEELDLVKSQLSESCSSLEKLQQEHAELLSARQEERKSEGSRIDEEQCAMLRKTLLAAQSRMQQMEDELKNASVLARQSLTLSSPPLGSPSRSNASERADEEQHELKKSLATAEARIEELEEKLRVAVEAQPSTTSPRVHAQVAVSGVDSCSVVISQETSEKRESSTSGGLLSVISAPLLNYFSPTTTTTAPAPALPPLPVLEPSPAQSLLDAALADNAELLETVRRLQVCHAQLSQYLW